LLFGQVLTQWFDLVSCPETGQITRGSARGRWVAGQNSQILEERMRSSKVCFHGHRDIVVGSNPTSDGQTVTVAAPPWRSLFLS
jgi:hypothetical protein